MFVGPRKEMTDKLNVVVVVFGVDNNIFHDSSAVRDVVKHISDAPAVIVSGVNDPEWQTLVLEATKRC